jgi:hypothetical protein
MDEDIPVTPEQVRDLSRVDPWGAPSLQTIAEELPEDVLATAKRWPAFRLERLQHMILCRMAGISTAQACRAAGFTASTWGKWCETCPEIGELVDRWADRELSRIASAATAMCFDPGLDPKLRSELMRWHLDRRSEGHAPPAHRVQANVDQAVTHHGVMVAPSSSTADDWIAHELARTAEAPEPTVEED